MPKNIQIGQVVCVHKVLPDGSREAFEAAVVELNTDGSINVETNDHDFYCDVPVFDTDPEGITLWASLPVELLDFGAALSLLKAGKTVTRLGQLSRITLPEGAGHLVIDGQAAWRPSDEDLLADDWALVEEGGAA